MEKQEHIRNKWIYHTPKLKLDECVDNAMSEYAKQEAIAFGEWLKNNAHNWENEWHIWNKENKRYDTYKTTKKLYQLFKQKV